MPMYRTHLMGGLGVYIGLLLLLRALQPSALTACWWLVLALIGSIFPDIDIKSKMQKWTYTLLVIVLLCMALYKRFELIACVSILFFTPLVVHHRGLFHRAWFIVLLGLGIVSVTHSYAPAYSYAMVYDMLFFIVGAFSHLWLDMGFKRMMRLNW
jgi:hypothetical protein